MGIGEDSLKLHEMKRGKLEIRSKVPIKNKHDLSLAYTPGVAEPCRKIAEDINKVFKYTIKGNTVAVISDGSSVLGLGNIGPEAAIPVMEGKAILLKELAGIDAFPICIRTQDTDEIVNIVKNIAPVFGGINLEDISAPRCFEIEERLQDIGIPVFHDDQHGTAVVVHAAITNSLRVLKKDISKLKIVISGAGAAGTAIAKMLLCRGTDSYSCSPVDDIIMVDRNGIISRKRKDLNKAKKDLVKITNKNNIDGPLRDALSGADVFIGVSAPNIVNPSMVRSMNKNPIVFAMANPTPEIMPRDALRGGAAIVGTGRSDFPNQINNVLAFPGIFRGALDAGATKITEGMKHAAAYSLAKMLKAPKRDKILPDPLDRDVARIISKAVKKKAIEQGVSRQSLK